MIQDIKLCGTILASILAIVGYIPYIKYTVSNKTKPHVISWLLWAIIGCTAFALQLNKGGGVGSFVTLCAGLASFVIFILAIKNGEKSVTISDIYIFLIALLAVGLWVVAEQPLWSAILISIATVLTFIPTFKKSWFYPGTETVFTWRLNAFRHVLSIMVIQSYNPVTILYPLTCVAANVLLSLILLRKRRFVS